jgi:hypothetical protein
MYNDSSSPIVTNCILWGDTPDEINGSAAVTYSCVQMLEGVYPGEGNIAGDPRFVGAADLSLRPDSPCINTGTSVGAPARDILGVSRPQCLSFDMGAYECSTATLEITQQPESRDVNVGDSVTFTVVVSGGFEPIEYQWQRDGGDLTEATLSMYTILSAQEGDRGQYNCKVWDECASLTSAPAYLTVFTGVPVGCGLALAGAALAVGFLGASRLRRRTK